MFLYLISPESPLLFSNRWFSSGPQGKHQNTKNVQIQEIEIPPEGRTVHLKAYGFIKVFRIVSKDGDIGYWATDILEMNEAKREVMGGYSWKIEEYHRGIKQFCGVENCQARKNQSQRAHIMSSLRAFLRLEVERLRMERSWFESKREIIRPAISAYIKKSELFIT